MDNVEQTDTRQPVFGLAGFACLTCLIAISLFGRPLVGLLDEWWAWLLIYSAIPLTVIFGILFRSARHQDSSGTRRIVPILLSTFIVYGGALFAYGLLMLIIFMLLVFRERIFSMPPPSSYFYQHPGLASFGGYQSALMELPHPVLWFVAAVLIATTVGVVASIRTRRTIMLASRLSLILLPFKSYTAVACLALFVWHTFSPHLVNYENATIVILTGYVVAFVVLCVGALIQWRQGIQACAVTCRFAAASLILMSLVFVACP